MTNVPIIGPGIVCRDDGSRHDVSRLAYNEWRVQHSIFKYLFQQKEGEAIAKAKVGQGEPPPKIVIGTDYGTNDITVCVIAKTVDGILHVIEQYQVIPEMTPEERLEEIKSCREKLRQLEIDANNQIQVRKAQEALAEREELKRAEERNFEDLKDLVQYAKFTPYPNIHIRRSTSHKGKYKLVIDGSSYKGGMLHDGPSASLILALLREIRAVQISGNFHPDEIERERRYAHI